MKTLEVDLAETEALFNLSGGDARKLLNLLELVVKSENAASVSVTDEKVVAVGSAEDGVV